MVSGGRLRLPVVRGGRRAGELQRPAEELPEQHGAGRQRVLLGQLPTHRGAHEVNGLLVYMYVLSKIYIVYVYTRIKNDIYVYIYIFMMYK